MNRMIWTAAALVISLAATVQAGEKKTEDGWVSLFNGKNFEGWKASENKDTWKIVDGAIVCHGPRSHLFYVGNEKPYDDFELKAKVMTKPGSNAGIYFHTKYQETGWPKYGYEAQVNNSGGDPKRTGSLYGVDNVSEAPAKDNEWFEMHIKVQGQKITIAVDGKTLVEHTEPEGKEAFSNEFERRLGKGTFALQGHDPNSEVHFKDIQVKRLD